MISKKFKIAIKLSDIPAWKIAHEAGIHPNVLSKIMSGALMVRPGDARVVKVGQVIGLNEKECFEANGKGETSYGN